MNFPGRIASIDLNGAIGMSQANCVTELTVCPLNLCAIQLNVEKGIGTLAAKALN